MTEVATTEFVMSEGDAERLTRRITLMAGTLREGMEKLHGLVAEAKAGNAHVALGYPSWTAYLAATLGKEPLRLDRSDRQELVGYLAGEGMSTRAIAPIVGVTHKTIVKDLQADVVPEVPPAPPVDLATVDLTTGEIREPITGLDGKAYTRPEPTSTRASQRRSLVDTARDAGQELRKATERLERIAADDRLTRNKEEVAAHLRHHLNRAIEVCQDLDNLLNNH